MDFAHIVDKVTSRDSSKWEYEALVAVETNADYLAYLRSPESMHTGPMTAQDKAMRDERLKIQKALADKMKKHYADLAHNGGPPSSLALEIEDAISDHDWFSEPDQFIDEAICKLTETPA